MSTEWDVAIVGAGTAGAALAYQLAERGVRVVVIEKGSLHRAGATWFNAVSRAAFNASGIPFPQPPEDAGCCASHIIAGWGPTRVRVNTDVHDIDMALLGDRLRSEAARFGAEFRDHVSAVGWDAASGLRTSHGTVRARTYVDAGGLRGLEASAAQRVGREFLCAAVQEIRAVQDIDAARDFFARHEVPVGEGACFTSVAGGYSVVNVKLHGDQLSILSGSIPGRGYPSGRALIEQFLAREPWVGAPIRSGSRAIPLTAPPDRIDNGAWLRFGDAAGMVWATHGSGIGPQLIASRVVGEALARGGSPADASAAWRRACRPALAEAAAFQRFSLEVNADLLARWMRAGLLHPELVRAGIEQRTPRLGPRVVGQLVRAMVRDPGAIRSLAPGAAGMIRARFRAARGAA